MASLKDRVLSVVGKEMAREREVIAAKAEKTAKGGSTREPKGTKGKSGTFRNVRHYAEQVLLELPEITPRAFAMAIEEEFGDTTEASFKNWNAAAKKEDSGFRGHYPSYRGYILNGILNFEKQHRETFGDEEYESMLKNAQEVLTKTLRKRKDKEDAE